MTSFGIFVGLGAFFSLWIVVLVFKSHYYNDQGEEKLVMALHLIQFIISLIFSFAAPLQWKPIPMALTIHGAISAWLLWRDGKKIRANKSMHAFEFEFVML